MTEEEIERFLTDGHVISVATVDEKGWPHCTPVWYIYRFGKIYFRAQPYKKKIRNILANPKVSCSLHSGDGYSELQGITILGIAKVVKDRVLSAQMEDLLLKKYASQRKTDMMAEEWRRKHLSEERAVVEITIRRLSSWDNTKWLRKV